MKMNLLSRLLARPQVGWWRARFCRFTIDGQNYPYFSHKYNTTWRNERAVEVAYVWNQVQAAYEKKLNILEIGNVLSHYFTIKHRVIDKYEPAVGVINQDIIDFKSKQKFDLIVSISTLEHVGWDEQPREKLKTITAVKKIRDLLTDHGRAIITFPIGYNQDLDSQLKKNRLKFDRAIYMRRINLLNDWV